MNRHTLEFTYGVAELRRLFIADRLLRDKGSPLALLLLAGVGIWMSLAPSWVWGGGVLIGASLMYLASLYAGLQSTMKFAGHPISVELTEASLVITTPFGRSEMPWAAFRSAHASALSVVLTFAPLGQSFHVPRRVVSTECETFLRSKILTWT